MKRDNIFIALYFIFSVGLLTFTRTVARNQQPPLLSESDKTTINTTTASTETTKTTETTASSKTTDTSLSDYAGERGRTTQSTDPIKTTSTTRAAGSTDTPTPAPEKGSGKSPRPANPR